MINYTDKHLVIQVRTAANSEEHVAIMKSIIKLIINQNPQIDDPESRCSALLLLEAMLPSQEQLEHGVK